MKTGLNGFMTYILVDTPYEKCFDLFFKNELGYPNFYRLQELLPDENQALVLIAPSSPTPEGEALHRIQEKIAENDINHCLFGENIATTFFFEHGQLKTQSQFQLALKEALRQFPASKAKSCFKP